MRPRPQEFLAILTEPCSAAASTESTATRLLGSNTPLGGFIFPLALEDIRLVLNEAESAGVLMPSVSVVRDRLITGIARGYSELDWSALGLLAAWRKQGWPSNQRMLMLEPETSGPCGGPPHRVRR